MSSERICADYLEDILDALSKVTKFIEGMTFDQFSTDDKTAFAVIRALEIIGEATKHIPEQVRESYPKLPWRGTSASAPAPARPTKPWAAKEHRRSSRKASSTVISAWRKRSSSSGALTWAWVFA